MKLVPFDLIGDKEVDQIVNIGDRGGKHGQETMAGVVVSGATAGKGEDLGPGSNIGKTGVSKDFRSLADDNFFGFVDFLRKARNGIV